MAITTLKKLLTKLAPWFESSIPSARTGSNDSAGRRWLLKELGYIDKLTLEDLKEATDRDELNERYVDRY
jgi:hypothetical protein